MSNGARAVGYGLTDVGRKRNHNEDSFLVNDEIGLYIVADGMGGHLGGEFASRMAVSTIEEVLQSVANDPEATVISGVNTDDADNGDLLRYAIEVASSRIFDRSLYDITLKGMGTTTVAAYFQGSEMFIANVGDSRAYLLHANKLSQVTTDHSLVSEQLQAGMISKQDAKKHKLKNIITRSVGYQEQVECDIKNFEVHMGDRILMCSDGLTNLVEDEELEKTLNSTESLKDACKSLIDLANSRGGDDNITVVIIEMVA